MAIATCSSALNDRALCRSIALTRYDGLTRRPFHRSRGRAGQARLVDLAIVRHRALDRRIKPRSRLARQPVLQFEILLLRRLQMRRGRVQRRALGEVEPTDCPSPTNVCTRRKRTCGPKEEVPV
jgi:hypothetical protein